jgi:hypothetical protein
MGAVDVSLQDLNIPLEISSMMAAITCSVGRFCDFPPWLKFSASVFTF